MTELATMLTRMMMEINVADANDAFPLDSTESVDTDGDGTGDNADTDDDDDLVLDIDDDFPLDPTESKIRITTELATMQTPTMMEITFWMQTMPSHLTQPNLKIRIMTEQATMPTPMMMEITF